MGGRNRPAFYRRFQQCPFPAGLLRHFLLYDIFPKIARIISIAATSRQIGAVDKVSTENENVIMFQKRQITPLWSR